METHHIIPEGHLERRRHDDGKWRIDKTLSIGNIISIVVVLMGMIAWLWNLQEGVTKNQTTLVQTIKVLDKLDARLTNHIDRINDEKGKERNNE